MMGGFSQQQVDQEHRDLIHGQTASINTKLGTSHAAFSVDHVWTQVVAGTNYFFHLSAGDHHYSVCIYQPLPHTN